MAEPLDKFESFFSVELHPNIVRIVKALNDSGFFGFSYPQTIERLICAWILEHGEDLKALGVSIHVAEPALDPLRLCAMRPRKLPRQGRRSRG